MHFEIVTAWKPHLSLNHTQTTSPKFEYEPIVCGTFLKHDAVLKRSLEQLLADLFRVRELVIADSIHVWKVDEVAKYRMTLPMLTEAELTAPYEVEVIPPPPAQEEASGEPQAEESTTPVPVEPPAPLVTPEEAPAVEEKPEPAPLVEEVPKAPKSERKKKQKQE